MFLKLYVKVRVFFESTEGASAIEYAIVAAMVAAVIVVFITPISKEVTDIFTGLRDALIDARPAAPATP
ncbi:MULTISPECIES: Flp family type IVb pilin [unclassified Pseudomonas]|uniref:Flp family type IVb pilin n=1 Tax=unclassified Pseudomonas TaxID=196821 RepID=UPI001391D378|nr:MULTISPECIES: Flp family type IVb pilin [unclassified Pseudomonas]KAI2669596.1 Flp family type IVb pilin [Pseudomonas sp. TNT3]MBF4556798.1 Flp family type IVb pilin [Pseudomonas sp. p50(2008)]